MQFPPPLAIEIKNFVATLTINNMRSGQWPLPAEQDKRFDDDGECNEQRI